ERPEATIVVTGCAAQIRPESFSEMKEVDIVLGNDEKMKAESFNAFAALKARGEKALVNDIMSVKETAHHLVSSMEGRARAFIQVQNGCDHRCTFCIIPFGRGPSRSVPVGEVVTQVRKLVEAGFKEIVLTGVDVSDYGKDLPGAPTLGQMMRRVLALVPELPRLRLSSIDAAEVDSDLLDLLANEPRLMPHLHISIQAGDDMILKRMKRRHLRQDVLDFCHQVRNLRPDVVFGADIIAGFPTETDAMFANTRALVEEADITWLHVFPFSPREGTPAAKMPQVARGIVKERAAMLREAGERQVRAYLMSQVGRKVNILAETSESGRTEGFAPARMRQGSIKEGAIISTVIQSIDGDLLIAA
ncbi:MAG: tRNA (N(6)-L-threonylcarbamoyladenosine(37)-C(2))-methylthiotransferase MtaB, partial [Alphaproteobacteria bacterium]|nr:tRNA (N(6)-L-threonylcarbamoyladenosine(37)-C(2))-methylthiotransferase MtaB [Alphaproteobacteria bacterium]